MVDWEIFSDYLKWLKPHIEELLLIPGFKSAEVFETETSDESPRKSLTVFYRMENREKLEAYFNNQAPRLRQDAVNHFGARFSAQRRIHASV